MKTIDLDSSGFEPEPGDVIIDPFTGPDKYYDTCIVLDAVSKHSHAQKYALVSDYKCTE